MIVYFNSSRIQPKMESIQPLTYFRKRSIQLLKLLLKISKTKICLTMLWMHKRTEQDRKIYAYLFWFILVFILVVVLNNIDAIHQLSMGIKQWVIIALAPIAFLFVSFWKSKIGETWFAIFI